MDEHREMISFGAGVNSVAMTIMLVNEGWRGPIVFADPGAEHPDTYCYIDYFEREWLRLRGLEVIRLSPNLTPGLYAPSYRMDLLTKCEQKQIVPIMFNRWCTAEYKRTPLCRWGKQAEMQTQLLGFAIDEAHRAKASNRCSLEVEYPLIDRRITRPGCEAIIEAAGLSVPPKSGCWFCPFQRQSEWRALYDLRPDLFNLAAQMDEIAYKKSGRPGQLQLAVNLGMNLREAQRMWDIQLELPLMPEPEYEYQMCECRL